MKFFPRLVLLLALVTVGATAATLPELFNERLK